MQTYSSWILAQHDIQMMLLVLSNNERYNICVNSNELALISGHFYRKNDNGIF